MVYNKVMLRYYALLSNVYSAVNQLFSFNTFLVSLVVFFHCLVFYLIFLLNCALLNGSFFTFSVSFLCV